MQIAQGIAGQGGANLVTSGVSSTTESEVTYPSCTVTVYLAGTVTLATIYSDNASTPKANPFSASASDASWSFYAANGKYDVRFSGAGISTPYTLPDWILLDDAVVSTASSTDNAVARWDGTSGNLLQNSVVIISDTGNITSPGTVHTFGDSTAGASARLNLTFHPTNTATTGRLANWWTQTFAFTNGPGGEPNYDDDQTVWSYNMSSSGAKTVAGIKDFGWFNEARFYAGGFLSEHYFQYRNPAGTVNYRPFGWVINETTSAATVDIIGDIRFFRPVPDNATQCGSFEDGSFDLSFTSAGSVVFANNVSGFKGKNAANNLSLGIAKINASDKVEIDPGGIGAVMPSNLSVLSISDITTLSGASDATTRIQFAGSGLVDIKSNGNLNVRSQPGRVDYSVALVFAADNTVDLGFVGGTNFRPRNIYAGSNVFVGASVDAVTSYKVGSTKVLGAQETGWTTSSGTPNKGAFAAYAGQTASVGYVQAEAQATDNAAKAASQRLKAVEDALRTHGLIN